MKTRWNGNVYVIEYHKKALKDIQKLKQSNLSNKAKQLIDVIRKNPFQNPPPYERLVGDLDGMYSRRINIQHRLVYQVIEDKKIIRILSLWSHYENV